MGRDLNAFVRWWILCSVLGFAALVIIGYLGYAFPIAATELGYPKEWLKLARRIEASKRTTTADTLYIGDSVGGQLMPFNSDNVLTSNGSVYPLGNYLLVRNMLERSPSIKTVMYLSVPTVIGHKFERKNTWNSFVKPFLTYSTFGDLDPKTRAVLAEYPQTFVQSIPPLKFLPFSDVDLENGQHKPEEELSPFAMEWLIRLQELCSVHGAELVLVSPPIGRERYARSMEFSSMREQIRGTELEELFENYLASITLLPDSLLVDDVHWNKAFVEEHREQLCSAMLRKIGAFRTSNDRTSTSN